MFFGALDVRRTGNPLRFSQSKAFSPSGSNRTERRPIYYFTSSIALRTSVSSARLGRVTFRPGVRSISRLIANIAPSLRAQRAGFRFPADVSRAVVRMVHAAGATDIADDVAFTPGVVAAANAALRAGARSPLGELSRSD